VERGIKGKDEEIERVYEERMMSRHLEQGLQDE